MLSITSKTLLFFLCLMRPNPDRERVRRTGQILQITPTNRLDGVEIFSKVLDFVRFCQVIVDNFHAHFAKSLLMLDFVSTYR